MKTPAACSTLALALLALSPGSGAAQATVPAWRELVIYAADPSYPLALSRRGVQGEATVEIRMGNDGNRVALVRESSRSAELDALAVRMAKRLDLRGGNEATQGLVRFRFRKDSDTTIATKSCADFNVDAAYHAATFQESNPRSMPVMVESIGRLIYSMHRENQDERKVFPPFEPVLDATVAACARTPEKGFVDVMRQEALKLIK